MSGSARNSLQTPPCSQNVSFPRARFGGWLSRMVFLDIEPGADIVQSVVQYACRDLVSLTVLSGTGFVSEPHINFPGSSVPPSRIPGTFEIVSFSGTCIGSDAASYDDITRCFLVSAMDAQGGLIGGVVTSMKAANIVTVGLAIITAPARI